MAANFDAIPEELKALKNWSLWKKGVRDGKPAKVPIQLNGRGAKSNDSSTWITFAAALNAYQNLDGFDGICCMMPTTPDSLIFIDLDYCIDDKGVIEPWAADVVKRFNSYTEKSQSGHGLHILIKGKKPFKRCRKHGSPFEIYDSLRPMYLTGAGDFPDVQAKINPRQDELDSLFFDIFGNNEQEKPGPADKPSEGRYLEDEVLLKRAMLAKNGAAFKDLWDGSTLGYSGDDSAADMALCNHLAFWTGKSALQMDRLFRKSRLMRPKWDENRGSQTYGEKTINEAIVGCTQVYEPPTEPIHEEPIKGTCDIERLIAVYKKWLYVKEDYSITGPMVAAVANFCPGDPDIIGIIAPSGSTKTEGIRALGEEENKFVYPLSSLTEHTFISGFVDKNGKPGRDLVPLLKHRLLVIKDLTTILSKKEDVRGQIFADFRELTDGYIEKEFGNGTKKLYKDIHSSILFACTNAIERYYSMYSNLGQRMIFMRPEGDKIKAREQSVKNRSSLKEMRADIHTATVQFLELNVEKTKAGLPTTSDAIAEEMGPLFDFLAVARTSIHHDFKGDIDEIPEPEYPTRIANTLTRLLEVHALIHGRDEVDPEDVAFGIRIIRDNVPTTRYKLLEILSKTPTIYLTTPNIATTAELPTGTAKRVLDEMFALHLL